MYLPSEAHLSPVCVPHDVGQQSRARALLVMPVVMLRYALLVAPRRRQCSNPAMRSSETVHVASLAMTSRRASRKYFSQVSSVRPLHAPMTGAVWAQLALFVALALAVLMMAFTPDSPWLMKAS